jgi:hypothetical protein
MKTMMEHPELLGKSLTFFPRLYHTYHFAFRSVSVMLECINYSGHRKSLSSPASPTLSEASSYLFVLTIASDATAGSSSSALAGESLTQSQGILGTEVRHYEHDSESLNIDNLSYKRDRALFGQDKYVQAHRHETTCPAKCKAL